MDKYSRKRNTTGQQEKISEIIQKGNIKDSYNQWKKILESVIKQVKKIKRRQNPRRGIKELMKI